MKKTWVQNKVTVLLNSFNLQFLPLSEVLPPNWGSVTELFVKEKWGQKILLLSFQLGSFTKYVEFQSKKQVLITDENPQKVC